MAVSRGLGKGLDSLIPNTIAETKSKKNNTNIVKEKPDSLLDINKIEPNREQPRRNFNEDSLLELADSIKQFGLLQPIIVNDKNGYYEIIAGERRWRACKLAGIKEIPVIIKKISKQEIVEISLIENIQREELNPIEEALAYKKLLNEFHLKQDEVAERVSKSRTSVTNSIRLLKLCDEVQQMLINDMISTGHARAILSIENNEEQFNMAQRIFDEKLSVREIEKIIKNKGKEIKEKKTKEEDIVLNSILDKLGERLKENLGTKVAITSKGKTGVGKIEIEYYSHDDLERIIDLLA